MKRVDAEIVPDFAVVVIKVLIDTVKLHKHYNRITGNHPSTYSDADAVWQLEILDTILEERLVLLEVW